MSHFAAWLEAESVDFGGGVAGQTLEFMEEVEALEVRRPRRSSSSSASSLRLASCRREVSSARRFSSSSDFFFASTARSLSST